MKNYGDICVKAYSERAIRQLAATEKDHEECEKPAISANNGSIQDYGKHEIQVHEVKTFEKEKASEQQEQHDEKYEMDCMIYNFYNNLYDALIALEKRPDLIDEKMKVPKIASLLQLFHDVEFAVTLPPYSSPVVTHLTVDESNVEEHEIVEIYESDEAVENNDSIVAVNFEDSLIDSNLIYLSGRVFDEYPFAAPELSDGQFFAMLNDYSLSDSLIMNVEEEHAMQRAAAMAYDNQYVPCDYLDNFEIRLFGTPLHCDFVQALDFLEDATPLFCKSRKYKTRRAFNKAKHMLLKTLSTSKVLIKRFIGPVQEPNYYR